MTGKGLLVVISSPSGGGKTTIIRKVLASGNGNFRYSISATTRQQRKNEVDGQDYYFLDKNEFERKRDRGEFAEWAEVHGHFYATPKKPLENWLREGKLVFLDLDVDGGVAIKEHFGGAALLIFVRPPSFESLRERLQKRKTESAEEIDKRLERYPKEIEKAEHYDYQIVNADLKTTVDEILEIIAQHYKN